MVVSLNAFPAAGLQTPFVCFTLEQMFAEMEKLIFS